jgi:GNAT superfamily N-acetyltransferase
MIIDESNAVHYRWADGCDGWRLADSEGLSFYILSREAVLEVEGVAHRLRSGQGLETAPGQRHRFRNELAADVDFLVVSAPRSQGDRVEEEVDMPEKVALDLSPLSQAAVPAVKELIAEVVLEFYGDLEFLPKDRDGLLRYYERTGYLRDLDGHALIYGPGDGLFLVLRAGDTVVGCGGLRRLAGADAELTRLWLKREWRGKGLGLGIFRPLIGRAESLGYARVFLDTSRRCSDAVRLFRRNGFAECAPYKESAGDLFLGRELARPAEAPAASAED